MQHLYASTVRVERPTITKNAQGQAKVSYTTVTGGEAVRCRLDLQFVRVGDIKPAIVAGKAPDRKGLLFCSSTEPIRAGDRLVTIPNSGDGQMPVEGVFEIRSIPDTAVGFASAHHIEVQVWESSRNLDNLWPGEA